MAALMKGLPSRGARALRDRALIPFLYNTGARVQEAAHLQAEHLDFDGLRVRLHGKGDKWRTCPLWNVTANLLRELVRRSDVEGACVTSAQGRPLTRFGIDKIVRRHGQSFDRPVDGATRPGHP